MISYVLYCILWSKPDVKLIEAPVDEYGMSMISETFNQFEFEATVVEEKMNSVKIKHTQSGFTAFAYAPNDYTQRSLSIKSDVLEDAASLDCDVRQKMTNLK